MPDSRATGRGLCDSCPSGNVIVGFPENKVLALHVLLTSDGEALRRIGDEGHLDEWADASIQWAKDTFGEDNVVGAHLHIDKATKMMLDGT